MEMSVKEYLDSVANPNTRKSYRIGIQKFCEWFGKAPSEILEMRKDDLNHKDGENLIDYRNRAARFEKDIEQFHNYLLQQDYKINTARNLTLGIRQLFRYYQMPVRIRAGSRVNKTVKTSKNFPMRIEHVRKMFEVADLRERVILTIATDLGLRISDFIGIKKEDLPPLDQESPVAFDVMTGKEEVVAHGFLSDETVKLLKVYLPTLRKDNVYLFPSNGESHISDEWLNRLLQRLATKSKIDLNGKSLTFHCFRKMFLSTSIDSGIGLIAGKKLCGKSISKSDDTYLTVVKIREKFKQLKKFLTIQQVEESKAEEIGELRRILVNLQENLTQQKTITDTVTKENLKIKNELQFLNDILNPLQPMLEFVNSFKSPEAMLEFLKAIKERSDTAKQKAESVPKLSKKAKELLHEAISDMIQKESRKVKQLLAEKTGITQEDILQAAIQAARESIEEEYGIKTMAREE
jgi:integrase